MNLEPPTFHMLALPIARRELLVLARAAGTWQKRSVSSLAVLGAGIVFAFIYHKAGQMLLNQAGHLLGIGLSMICLFAGVSLTADSIAEEKREGTLGLLLLTNLSPFEIVLGKLVAHGVLGFYTVFCALPLLSMSMIFGGMRLGDVMMYVFSALNLLFFSAAVGLLASSICWEKRRANTLGTLIVMFFWLGLPGLALLLNSIGAAQWLIDTFALLSVNLSTSIGGGLGTLLPSTSARWWNLAWPQILAWALIGLTVWWLPRRWEDEPAPKKRPLRDLWKAISYGTPATRLKLRRRLLDRNPFMWLASRARLETAGAWIIIVLGIAVLGSHFAAPGAPEPGLLIAMGFALSVLLQLVLSAAAGGQLLREYEQGTLEMVLSTPLSVQEVIRGQLAAVLRQYRNLFGLAFLVLWAGLLWLVAESGSRRLLGIISLALYSGLLLLNFYALGWVGMWCRVKAADPKKANANGFFLITIFPGLMFGLIVTCANFLNWLGVTRFAPGPELVLPLPFVLAFANCIYWLLRAKRELPRGLRRFAFRRYSSEERPTLFGQLGKLAGHCLHFARAIRKKILPNPP